MGIFRTRTITNRGLALAVFLFSVTISFAASQEKAGKPSILFIGKPGTFMETEYLDELQAHGFDVDAGKWEEITPHTLRRYNAVVVTGYAYPDDSEMLDKTRQRYLEEYMRKGGGVLFFLNTAGCYDSDGLWDIPEFLKKFGIDFYAEPIVDKKHEILMSPPALKRYSCKTALIDKIAKHPVSEGVTNIWYPTGWGGHATAKSTPVNYSHQWTSILETSPDAELTFREDVPADLWRKKRPNGPFSIFAVRNVDNGRMAVIGVEPMWLVWSPYHPALGQIIMKKGEKGKSSDFWKLLENTYTWLSEPSLNTKLYGKEVAKKPSIPGDTPPIAWKQLKFPGKPSKYYKGICGAHTNISTGKGTVKDWVQAAKKNGFDFIIFTEDLAHMNKEKWEKLQADCLAESDDNFIAYAGLEYKNVRDNRGLFIWGNKRPWIKKDYLTDDGKKINIDRGWTPQKGHAAKTGHKSGQIMAFLEQKTNCFFDHKHNEAPFWDYKLYNIFSVFSCEDKKPLDNAVKEYLHTNAIHCNPAPYAIDLLYDPKDLDTAAKNGRPFLAVSADPDPRFPEEATLKNVFNRMVVADPDVPYRISTGGYRGWCGPVATQGPKLRLMFRAGYRWMGVSFPRYWIERHQGIEEKDWYMDDWYHQKIKLDAESENGLKTITVYDGEKVIREFDPKGAKIFSVQLNIPHNQTRHIAVVVTDNKGLKAVSREIWMEQQQHLYNFCGDHVNNANSIYSPIHGHPYFRNIRLKRGRIDEQPLRKARIPRDEVRRFFVDMISPDVLVERYRTDWVYNLMELSDQFGWHNWAPHHERDDYTFEQRGFEYFNRHGKKVSHKTDPSQNVHWDGFGEGTADIKSGKQPAELSIFENVLTLKKPYQLDKDGLFGKSIIKFEHKLPVEYAIITPGRKVTKGNVKTLKEILTGPISPGTVITAKSGDIGESILWHGNDLVYRIGKEKDSGCIEAGLKIGDKNKKGESFTWRFQRVDRAVDAEQLLNPKWFAIKRGKVDGLQLCELHVQADDGATEILLKKSAFDTNMQPIIVGGLNIKSSIFLYVKNRKLIRPIGFFDGNAYTQVPATYKNADLVIGNLLKTDNADVRVIVVRDTDSNGKPTGKWLVEVHNPTGQTVTTTLSTVASFGLLKDKTEKLTIPAKSSKNIVWEEK